MKKQNKILISFLLILAAMIFYFFNPIENTEANAFKQKVIEAFSKDLESKPLKEFFNNDVKAVCFIRAESYSKKYAANRYDTYDYTTLEKFKENLPSEGYRNYIGTINDEQKIKFIKIKNNEFEINKQKFYFTSEPQYGGVNYECMDISDLIIKVQMTGKEVHSIGLPLLLIAKGK